MGCREDRPIYIRLNGNHFTLLNLKNPKMTLDDIHEKAATEDCHFDPVQVLTGYFNTQNFSIDAEIKKYLP